MRKRWPLILGAAIVVAGSLAMLIPFLTRNRDYPASIPSPAPLFRDGFVNVGPSQSACFKSAVIEQHSKEARFTTRALAAGPPLRITMIGPGYNHTYALPGGYSGRQEQYVAVAPPSQPTPLRVCIENRGRSVVGLFAATDRTRSRSVVTVGGRPHEASIVFGFWEHGIVDVRRRLPDIASRVTIFRPAYVGRLLVWAIELLLVIAVPALLLLAFARAMRADDPDSGERAL